MSARSRLQALGPGVLFAGAAVGVSHLVQSTRAGASFGLSLVLVVLLANLVKYPAFRFGPQYASATGRSLLEGYRKQGRWALLLYGVLTVATMFAVEGAVTLVTAGLAKLVFGADLSVVWIAAILLGSCTAILVVGRYPWLERLGKVVVSLLAVCTIAATVVALPRLAGVELRFWPELTAMSTVDVMFIVALVGWMPTAIDVSAWQSLWTLERERASRHRAQTVQSRVQASLLDFHLGYVGSAFLALCFLILGAAVMHGAGEAVAPQPAGFAEQLVDLYGLTLGSWSRPLIGWSAFLVMFSTTLTVVDGFPRVLAELFVLSTDADTPNDAERRRRLTYSVTVALLGLGSLVVLSFFQRRLTAMVDLATTLSFMTAPVLAWLNHRAVLQMTVPIEARPSTALIWASALGIVAQAVFAAYYVALRVG